MRTRYEKICKQGKYKVDVNKINKNRTKIKRKEEKIKQNKRKTISFSSKLCFHKTIATIICVFLKQIEHFR